MSNERDDVQVQLTKDSVLLSVEVSRQIHLLLAHSRRRPSTSLELIVLPANAVVGAGVLLLGDLAVGLDHGALDVGDVLLLGQSAEGACWGAGLVGSEEDTRAGRVELVARVADVADAGDVDGAAAAEELRRSMARESSEV
jgi:hypothetical protein